MKRVQCAWRPQGSLLAVVAVLFCPVILSSSCASTRTGAPLPETSVYAPADIIDPFIPLGEPVDPATISSLTLDQALLYADAHAPAIRTALARAGVAQADIVESEIVFPANPQVSFGAGGRTIQGATGFELEAESFSGAFRSQLPVDTGDGGEATEFPRGNRSLDGIVNGGGARLETTTFSGSITIEVS